MKKILAVNLGDFGSTGNIARNVLDKYDPSRDFVYFAFPQWTFKKEIKKNELLIGFSFIKKIREKISIYSGLLDLLALFSTFLFLCKVKRIHPSVIHLHNLHGSYISFPLLFHFIKQQHIPIIWTLHDCWAFTGRCPYFDLTKCEKWKTGCYDCPYPKKSYPQSYVDTTCIMWKFKCRWFKGIENCTIVTPSQWLADLVKKSFLKDYPVKVINNGIDLSVFKPTESIFREKYGLVGKKVVLGVAFDWGMRKGLDVFIELARRLPDDFRIVLVGTDDSVDKQLPANVISIHRTQNQKELAEIYTAADVFVNPTREENYPTVNMESIACGTPVVTFRTGGSSEIPDETCGSVVDCDDVDAMEIEIRRICEEKPYSIEACLTRAKTFDMNARFQEYVDLYKEL